MPADAHLYFPIKIIHLASMLNSHLRVEINMTDFTIKRLPCDLLAATPAWHSSANLSTVSSFVPAAISFLTE